MWWKNSLCTSATEDLGTLAEYDPLTKTTITVRQSKSSEDREIGKQFVNSTPHTSPFFSFTAHTCNDMSNDIGSSVGARHPIHVSCARVIVCSLFDPRFPLFICLSHLLLHPLEL